MTVDKEITREDCTQFAQEVVEDFNKFLEELTANSGELKFEDSTPILKAIGNLGAWLNEVTQSIKYFVNEPNVDPEIVNNRITNYNKIKGMVLATMEHVKKDNQT